MKPTAILSATLLALASTASLGAYAETADGKPQATETQTAKPAVKKMKPHSHAEEKMGISLPVKSAQEVPPTVTKKRDKTKHYHPADGK